MGNKKNSNVNSDAKKYNWNIVIGLLIILTLISIVFSGIIFFSMNNLNNKIDSINHTLEIGSEDHYSNIRKNMEKSVVLVVSYPASSNNGTSIETYLDADGKISNLVLDFQLMIKVIF